MAAEVTALAAVGGVVEEVVTVEGADAGHSNPVHLLKEEVTLGPAVVRLQVHLECYGIIDSEMRMHT